MLDGKVEEGGEVGNAVGSEVFEVVDGKAVRIVFDTSYSEWLMVGCCLQPSMRSEELK